MPRFIRILPITIIVTVLFLIGKLADVQEQAMFVSRGMAQQQNGEGATVPKEEPKAEEKEETKEEPESEEEPASEKEGEGKKKEEPNPNVSDTPGALMERNFSKSEIDLLQSLARRRQDLDRWERNIQVKEEALNATERRIDEKIKEIEAMRKAVTEVLTQYNTQEEAKVKSLVKIYENMKPDDAARIFDEVEMPVLLLVIDKMAEKKAAPILAKMNAKKAKQITVELAEQRRLNTGKLNAGLQEAGQ